MGNIIEIIKYIITASLPIIALLISKRYAAFVDSAVERAKSYFAFVCHIERKIGTYLTPPRGLGDGFSDPALSEMINMISEGERLIDAYVACRGTLPPSVDEILVEFFTDFGKGDASLEVRRAREAALRLERALSDEATLGEKQKRICSAVAPSLAIALVIWLI